jgi:uncharacterized protein DUF3306
MSAPEKFLDRWSRRKREGADEPAPVVAEDAAKVRPPPDGEAKEAAAEVPFDPASLPPIESISANSDIRAFLQARVPPDLSRAALRRAWSTDPAIRDFIGLVENGWDFNDPNGIPGFGPIAAADVAQLLARVIGAPPAEPDTPQAQASGDPKQNPPQPVDSEPAQQLPQDQPAPNQDLAAPEKDSVQRVEDDVAVQNNSDDRENFPLSRQRGHGGALPKL